MSNPEEHARADAARSAAASGAVRPSAPPPDDACAPGPARVHAGVLALAAVGLSTGACADKRTLPWMSLYFTVGVWLSLALVFA